jgi:hypothetical protein
MRMSAEIRRTYLSRTSRTAFLLRREERVRNGEIRSQVAVFMYETSHYTPWASCNFHLSGNVGNVWEW